MTDIVEKIKSLESEIRFLGQSLNAIEAFDRGEEYGLSNPIRGITVKVDKSDFVDGFVDKKRKEIQERLKVLELKIETISKILEYET